MKLNKKLILSIIIFILCLSMNCYTNKIKATYDVISNTQLTYKERDNQETLISGFDVGATIGEIVNSYFSSNYKVEIYDVQNNNITSNAESKIGTGYKIELYENNELVKTYRTILYGDTNGDARINAVDALVVVKNKLGTVSFKNEEFKEAGRVDKRTREFSLTPTAVDALLIVKYRLMPEEYNISQNIYGEIEEKKENLFLSTETYEANGDEDKDGLTNAEEEKLGTNVYSIDTDMDGLIDSYEVKESKTNPLIADSDGDGIDDGNELVLGLNPLKADSKGDGIIDGERTLTYEVKDDELGVNIEITGKGNIASTTIDEINASVVEEGALDKIYNFYTTGNMDNAVVKIKYDVDEINKKGLNEEKLSIYYLNLNSNQLEKIETTIDKENKELTADLSHFSPYVVADFDGVTNKELLYKEKLEAIGWVDCDNDGTLDGYKRVDSGFLPDRDGFSFDNYGSTKSTAGHCYGMANFAMLYYMNQLPLTVPNLEVKSVGGEEIWHSNGYDLSDTYFENGGNLYDYKISDEGLKILLGEKPSDYYSGIIDDTLQIREKYLNKFRKMGANLYIAQLASNKGYSKYQFAQLNEDNETFNNNVKKDESQLLNAIWRLFIVQAIDEREYITSESAGLAKQHKLADENFKKLEQSLIDKIPVIFSFTISEVGGHSINAIQIIDDMNDINKFKVAVYDNNYPGEIRYVECTRHRNFLNVLSALRKSKYWYSFEYDWNNDGEMDTIEDVSIRIPENEEKDSIYVKLYDDGTLAFTATDKVLEGKTVVKSYGDIYGKEFEYNTKTPWYYERKDIKSVNIVDKIYPKSTAYWFYCLSELTEMKNISNLDTSKVTDMKDMFYGCNGLTRLDLSSIDTSKVINMHGMFFGCTGLTSLNLSSFDTSEVTDMGRMFSDCSSLTSLDLSSFDTSEVTDMEYMFDRCSALTSLDLSSFDTSNVTDVRHMFNNCESLTNLDLNSFDTSKVTYMEYMFESCKSLTNLDLSSFDTSKVTNMGFMFSDCSSLTSLDLSSFDTSKVTNMHSMFSFCLKLTSLDLSSFDTSKVTDSVGMFDMSRLAVIYIGNGWTIEKNEIMQIK